MRTDWTEAELGDVFDFVGGGTPSKSVKEYWDGDVPWASVKDIKGGVLTATGDFITELGLNKSAANLAYPEEIILATRIIPGRPILSKIRTSINQDLKIARLKITSDINYLFFALLNAERAVVKASSGTTVLGIRLEALRDIRLPLPPLPEQRAIVAKLEQLFSELDNGIANLQRVQEKLKVYRLSIMESVNDGSETRPIGDLLSDLSQGWSPKCINSASTNENEWAVIKTSAIQSCQFVFEENKILPVLLTPREQHELVEGDLLITRAGPRVRVGVCCLVKHTRKRLLNCDKVYRMKVKQSIMLPAFLEFVLNSASYLLKIEGMKTGGSDSGLNLTQTRFLKLEVPVPSIAKQHQIVQEIESRLSVCDKLEESITTNLQKAEALRQSILKKAFEGELLSAAELAVCRKEKDWCPAGELLGKVKSKKEVV